MAENSDKEINFLDTTLSNAKDLTSEQSLISAHILSPQELYSTLTSLPATHHWLEKGLSKAKSSVFLEQTSAKSFVENITQFKTRLRARDYPNSLVESRLTSEVKFSERKSALQQQRETMQTKF